MEYGPLAWLIAGLLLMGLEVIVPGFVLFWFGAGALLTALLAFLTLLTSVFSQALFFSISSLAFLTTWHFYLRRFFKSRVVDETRDPTLFNKRGRVTRRIEPNRSGEVELYDNFHGIKIWSAESSQVLEEGEEVMAVEANGIKLVVRRP
ncbi:MAG: NfeD family protein [Spirochaetes bacterium]|nr:NfeD family protein [Spirochaetota bacterium]